MGGVGGSAAELTAWARTAKGTKVAAAAASAAAARTLVDAATAGNLAELRRALDAGTDPNALVPGQDADTEECETTALAETAGYGHLEVTTLLLDRGASPDKPDSRGITPLMHAACHGHAAMVGLLLERGADLTATNPRGATAFHFACAANQPGCVEALVRTDCDMAAKTKDGRTGKMMAEAEGNTEVLERLRDLVVERLGEASREAACYGNLLVPFPLSQGATC